jgi:hypothetical protein
MTPEEKLAHTEAWALACLDGIEKAPGGWGPPLAVELQYITLCECLLHLKGTETGSVRRMWSATLVAHGYKAAFPLSSCTEGYDDLQRVLPFLRGRVVHGEGEPLRYCAKCGQGMDSDYAAGHLICDTCVSETLRNPWMFP